MVDSTKAEAHFEWPKNNDGWNQSDAEQLLKMLPCTTEVDGCAHKLKNLDGRYMWKTWKTASTSLMTDFHISAKRSWPFKWTV